MRLKRNLLALAVASVLVSHVHTLRAADAPAADQPTATPDADETKKKDAELGEIKVTGVRAAIERAISVKQNSNEIVEAISAEDIGKLPQISIADSLATLPGVTAQYVNGQPTYISIRGFSGDFNGTLVNGREQVSTDDNRAVNFYQYPAEVMTGLQVYKTPMATLIGQGISGTVNMDTLRPLDYNKREFNVGAFGSFDSNSSYVHDTDTKGYRVHASYIDQFLDHTLGVTIGVHRIYNPQQNSDFQSWGYTTVNVPAGTPGDPAGGQVLTSGGEKVYPAAFEDTRDAAISTIQWQPNDAFLSTLDLYYSKDNQNLSYGGFEAGLPYGSNTVLSNPVVSNGVLVGGTWSGVKPVLREELDDHNDKIYEVGWNNKFHFGDHWTAIADLSYGKATSRQSFMEQYAGTVPGTPGATDTWNYQVPDPYTGMPVLTPGLNYADPNIIKLVDSGGWGQDGYLKDLNVSDEIKAARFDLIRDLNSAVSKIDIGFNYNERTKTRNSDEWFLDLPGGKTSSANVPSNCLVPPIYIGYLGFPPTLAWDMNCNFSSYQQIPNYNGDITAKDWNVREKVTTGYVLANIDTEIAGQALRGNVGAQYVHTEQNSNAYANLGEATTSGGTSYNKFLPSLNLTLALPEEMDLKFGAAKQMSRPRLDDEKASIESSISVPPPNGVTGPLAEIICAPSSKPCLWTATGGNPELKPFLANAYDLSWEKYFDDKGYVQATYWYKQLQTYIYDQTTIVDFAKLGVPNPSGGNLIPSSSLGLLTLPANGTGGFMRGLELSAVLPLEQFSERLDGFGLQFSYSHTDSSIQPNGPGTSSPFPGLSKYVSNAQLYYEQAGFSARISAVHRSDYLGEVQAFGADQAFVNIRASTYTNMQIGYEVQSGALQGMNFYVQATNIFNTPYEEFSPIPGYDPHLAVTRYDLYGRQVFVGFNYKF
jgi:iron complex outermembrane receptor protein